MNIERVAINDRCAANDFTAWLIAADRAEVGRRVMGSRADQRRQNQPRCAKLPPSRTALPVAPSSLLAPKLYDPCHSGALLLEREEMALLPPYSLQAKSVSLLMQY